MGKISGLTEKTTIHDTDLLPMVDIEGAPDTTKRITWANLKKLINKIVDPTDQDTLVEAEEDQVTMDVAGVEAFLLSSVGIQTLAKQSASKAYLDADWPGIVTVTVIRVPLNAEVHDIQNEFNTRRLTGQADATEAFELHDADGGFESGDVGAYVHNTSDNTYAIVTDFTDSGQITLDTDIMADTENYTLYHARWTATEDGKYLVIGTSTFKTTNMEDQKAHHSRIHKNGTALSAVSLPSSGAVQFTIIAQDVFDIAANDYLELHVYHNGTSGAMDLRGLVSQTFLSVIKVG